MKQKYRRIFSFGKTLLLPLICSGAIPILAQTTELPTETEKNNLNSEQETSLTEKQLTSLLKQAGAEIQSIQCAFTQTKKLSILEEPLLSHGNFYLLRQGDETQISLEYSEPAGNRILLTPKKLYIQNSTGNQTLSGSSHPMFRYLETLFAACLTGELKDLIRKTDTEYLQTPHSYKLILCPTSSSLKKRINLMKLEFDKTSLLLETLYIETADGDSVLYEFSDKITNQPIDGKHFIIQNEKSSLHNQ